jgi:endonuclease III
VSRLKQTYGNPRHGNPTDSLDDLFYIVLSTRTRSPKFSETFNQLKAAFPTWEDLSVKHGAEIERILRPGGLGRLKARQIIGIAESLRRRTGTVSLKSLKRMRNQEAENLLTALPGVGPKIAKCVLMYTLGREVLPVDVHVHRVATRLGIRTKKRPDTSQDLIESAVPPKLRYSFHVNAIALGRSICVSHHPKCHICPISIWCRYFREHRGTKNAVSHS